MKKPPFRVALIEDDPVYRDAVSNLLRTSAGLEFLSAHPSGEHALKHLDTSAVDVVLVDLGLSRDNPKAMDGRECIRELVARRPDLLACVWTVFEDDERIFESLRAGAKGYLLKKRPWTEMVEGIVELIEGGSPMSPAVARRVVRHFSQNPGSDSVVVTKLTERELQILHRLSEGKSSKEAAEAFGISLHTVHRHCQNIYAKLGVSNRQEAIRLYRK